MPLNWALRPTGTSLSISGTLNIPLVLRGRRNSSTRPLCSTISVKTDVWRAPYESVWPASIARSLMAMILPMGSTPLGQTSTHCMHLVQSQTPPYSTRSLSRDSSASSRGSATKR